MLCGCLVQKAQANSTEQNRALRAAINAEIRWGGSTRATTHQTLP